METIAIDDQVVFLVYDRKFTRLRIQRLIVDIINR